MVQEKILWRSNKNHTGPFGENVATGVYTLNIYTIDGEGDACIPSDTGSEEAECSDELLQPLDWTIDPDGKTSELLVCGKRIWHINKDSGVPFTFAVAYRGRCPTNPYECRHHIIEDTYQCFPVSEESLDSEWELIHTYPSSEECLNGADDGSAEGCGVIFGTTTCDRITHCVYHPVYFTIDADGNIGLVDDCGVNILNINKPTSFIFDFDHILMERSEEVSEESCPPPSLTKYLSRRVRIIVNPDGDIDRISLMTFEDCICGVETLCHTDILPMELLAATSLPNIGNFPVLYGPSPIPGQSGSGWYGAVTYTCFPESTEESTVEQCVVDNVITFEVFLICSTDVLCAWTLFWKCSNYPGGGFPAEWRSCFVLPINDPCFPDPYPGCEIPPPCPLFELRWCEGTPGNNCPPRDPEIHQCCVFAAPPIPPGPNDCPEPPIELLCISFVLPPPE